MIFSSLNLGRRKDQHNRMKNVFDFQAHPRVRRGGSARKTLKAIFTLPNRNVLSFSKKMSRNPGIIDTVKWLT